MCEGELLYKSILYILSGNQLTRSGQKRKWGKKAKKLKLNFLKEKHGEFVSLYGTTNVAEDIADTFTAFILQDSKKVKEGTELKYKKIAFFYQFPELVKMRAEVLAGLYDVSKTIEQPSGH